MQTPVASRQTALPGKTARAEKGCVAEYARRPPAHEGTFCYYEPYWLTCGRTDWT